MGGTVKLRAELPRSDWNVILSNLEYQKFESPWLVEIINKLEKEITGGGRKPKPVAPDCCFQEAYGETCQRCGGDD